MHCRQFVAFEQRAQEGFVQTIWLQLESMPATVLYPGRHWQGGVVFSWRFVPLHAMQVRLSTQEVH